MAVACRSSFASLLAFVFLLSLEYASAFSPTFTGRSLSMPSSQSRSVRFDTGLHMNMADRFMRVAKANINNMLSKVEDPEKVLEQAVLDMQKDLVKVRQSYAEVSATSKRLERQKEQADKLAADWYARAELAMTKGDETLAREALTRRQQQVDTSSDLESQLSAQKDSINNLFAAMQTLEAKIAEAKSQKEQLQARARTAATTAKVNDMLSGVGSSSSVEAFERMKEKVDSLEAKAEISGQLAGSTPDAFDLESKFKALAGDSEVDKQLAMLKNKSLPPSEK